jgi:guanylate kinase
LIFVYKSDIIIQKEVVKIENKYKIIAIMGRSASGKSTLLSKIMNTGIGKFNRIVEYTTRPKRANTFDEEYIFISEKEYQEKETNGDIFAPAIFNDWHYGFDKQTLSAEKYNIGIFSPAAIAKLYELKSEFDIFVIITEASDKTILTRSLYREASPNCIEVCRRFLADYNDFMTEKMPFAPEQQVYIINTEKVINDEDTNNTIAVIEGWAKQVNQ